MPTPVCSKCRRTLSPDDINVANDVASCRECNLTYRLSELAEDNEITATLDLQHPPAGAWFTSDGGGAVIGATNRSLGTAAGLLFFALFWNGIVSVFVCLALSGTLHVLNVPLPEWFPAPKMNDAEMSAGMVIFLWLFLTPFITVGVTVAASCLNCLFGRTEVRVSGTQGSVFTGIGPLGWRRHFDASQVKSVQLDETRSSKGQRTDYILMQLRVGKQIKFGSQLSGERRQFFLGAMRRALLR